MISINSSVQEIIYESDPTLKVIEHLLLDIFKDNTFLIGYLGTETYEETLDYDKEMHNSDKRCLNLRRGIEDLIISGRLSDKNLINYYREAKEIHDNVSMKRNELIALHKEVLATGKNLSRERQVLLKEHKTELNKASIILSDFIDQINYESRKNQLNLVSKIKTYSILILGLILIFLIVILYRIVKFSNSIVAPLEEIINNTKRFVKGDYSVRVGSNPNLLEIRDLQKNINNVFRAVEENISEGKSKKKENKILLKKEYHEIIEYLKQDIEAKKQTTISDMKKHLNVTHPTILSRIKFLEMKGYLKIVKVGREKFLELTEKSSQF